MKYYVIDQVSWYEGQPLRQDIRLRFRTIAEFLQENNLTERPLITPGTGGPGRLLHQNG